jgi:hypothetical protein
MKVNKSNIIGKSPKGETVQAFCQKIRRNTVNGLMNKPMEYGTFRFKTPVFTGR